MRKKLLAVVLCLCLALPLVAVSAVAAQPAREEYQRCVNLNCRYGGEEHEGWNPGTFYRCTVCGEFSQDSEFVCSCADEPETDETGAARICPICGKKVHRNFWQSLWHAILTWFMNWKTAKIIVDDDATTDDDTIVDDTVVDPTIEEVLE